MDRKRMSDFFITTTRCLLVSLLFGASLRKNNGEEQNLSVCTQPFGHSLVKAMVDTCFFNMLS